MTDPLPPKPPKTLCAMPTHCPSKETAIYQTLRQMHCDDRHPSHECQGRLVIDRNGVTLACPRSGDARSVFAAVAGKAGR